MSVLAEFDLPLILLVVRAEGGLDPRDDPPVARRLARRGSRNVAEPTLPSRYEFAVALPNTAPDVAPDVARAGDRAVERRVREVLPDAAIGVATGEPDDEVSSLLERARGSRRP
jgi:PleD family two-component response regulator